MSAVLPEHCPGYCQTTSCGTQRDENGGYAFGGTAELLERIRQLDDVLTEAAALDADAATLRDDIELRQRREAMRVLAGWLSQTGPLRGEMTVEHAADILWVLTSPEVHRLYRKHCGWSAHQYAHWLTTAMLNLVAGADNPSASRM